jgi:hypothetical protein
LLIDAGKKVYMGKYESILYFAEVFAAIMILFFISGSVRKKLLRYARRISCK